jgi:hypothetical protein
MLHDRANAPRGAHLASLAGQRSPFQAPMAPFAGFSVSVRDEPQRQVVVVESAVPGYRKAPILNLPGVASYGVESMPGLFARTQRRRRLAGKASPMAAVSVDLETWERAVQSGAVDRKTVRRATLTLKAGRYAIFEGFGSISRAYRVWRRDFDGWLAENGECPRPDQVFVKFPNGAPHTLFESAQFTLYIPLEPVTERAGLRRAQAARASASD